MRHLTAVHLDPAENRPGGWHYASLGKRGGGPIGFCPQHDPHTTEREARACYAAYERSLVRLDVMYGNWQGCAICDSPTKSGAGSGGYRDAPLCGDHRDLSTVYHALHLDEPAGDSWGS